MDLKWSRYSCKQTFPDGFQRGRVLTRSRDAICMYAACLTSGSILITRQEVRALYYLTENYLAHVTRKTGSINLNANTYKTLRGTV